MGGGGGVCLRAYLLPTDSNSAFSGLDGGEASVGVGGVGAPYRYMLGAAGPRYKVRAVATAWGLWGGGPEKTPVVLSGPGKLATCSLCGRLREKCDLQVYDTTEYNYLAW